MIQGIIQLFAITNTGQVGEYWLSDNYFNDLTYSTNMEKILMGLMNQASQRFDKEVSTELTNKLFPEDGHNFGSDLVARNIQRGRDHGLPEFCCYYRKYHDPNFNCHQGWNVKYDGFSDDDWSKLETIYEKPSDIDLFTGGLAQAPSNGAMTGSVFSNMKGCFITIFFFVFCT